MEIKFVQITSNGPDLFGLDEEGRVWQRVKEPMLGDWFWKQIPGTRVPNIVGGVVVQDEE